MRCKRLCGSLVVVVALLALLLGYVARDANGILGEKDLEFFNDAGCELLGADILMGGEDVALWRGGVAVVSAGDCKTTFKKGAGHARLTGIFALNLAAAAAGRPPAAVGLRRLELLDFPAGPPLVGLGVYLSNKTQRLYVVNHDDSGSQVDIFSIEGQGLEDMRLRHVGRIRSPLFPFHCINDVVEGRSPDEVYVSVWRTAESVQEYKAQHEKFFVFHFLAYRYVSRRLGSLGVLRCARPTGGGSWSCARTSAWGMPDANGLTVSPDRTRLLVSSSICTEIWQFAVGQDGDLTEAGPRIPLPYPVDNLEWDEETGRVFLGAIPVAGRSFPLQSPLELMSLPTAELFRDPAPRPTSLMRHDGSKLSASSAGVQFGEAMLVGSPDHPGVLVCSPAWAAAPAPAAAA